MKSDIENLKIINNIRSIKLREIENNDTRFNELITELINNTPTSDLRNTFTHLQILKDNMNSNHQFLLKTNQL